MPAPTPGATTEMVRPARCKPSAERARVERARVEGARVEGARVEGAQVERWAAALGSGVAWRVEGYGDVIPANLPEEPHGYLGVLATGPDRRDRAWAGP